MRNDYIFPGKEHESAGQPGFPHAPADWTEDEAERQARTEGLSMGDTHWEVIRALQDYYDRHEDDVSINVRLLHDALDERFHASGGIKKLYHEFPGGPVAQGCRLAGLNAPAGAEDQGFGSVV